MKKLSLIFCIVSILFFYSNTIQADSVESAQYLKNNIVKKKLKNGITLIMLNRGYAPTLAFEISFRVGSVDESYENIGTAHMLEHMLFKGTDKIGTTNYKSERIILEKIESIGSTLDRLKLSAPNSPKIDELEKELKELQKEHQKYIVSSPYDQLYTSNGGVGFNASTSKDKTGYYIELPSSKLELWATLESERLRNPVFREYYLERNNIIQERLMRYDSNGTGGLFEKFLANAFIAHPYRHPIIGWGSNIPFLALQDVKDFYRKYYIPSRMVITIVGKQNTEETYKVIDKYFSGIEAKPEPAEIAIKEPKQNGELRFVFDFESSPYLIIGWHKPTFPSKDDYICDVIAEILAGGKSSRLYKSLVLDKKVAASVDTWNGVPGVRYDNMFVIFVTPKSPHSSEEVEKGVYEEIDRMQRDVTDEEIQRVVNKMESELVFSLSSNKGLAALLSYYQTVYKDWAYALDYLQVISTIKPDDVKAVMKKYFTSDNRTVGVLRDSRKQ